MYSTTTTQCGFYNSVDLDLGGGMDFEFASSTCTSVVLKSGYNPTTTINGTSTIAIYASMSSGEVLISLFLLLLIVIEMCKSIAGGLSNINTKKKFLAYNGGDVEVRDDL